jgi:hypothetical protein
MMAKLAGSQEMMTRILEDEHWHRELLGNSDRRALLPTDEPIDEEVTLLIEGIAEEVAAIGVLLRNLHGR